MKGEGKPILVLGRIKNISRGRIGRLIRMRWINSFPLRGVKIFP
jgi:hypothetical protein